MNESKTAAAPRCTKQQLVGIRDALLALGITGDSLFASIREDIERGLICGARTRLNFVDAIVNTNTADHGNCTDPEIDPLVDQQSLQTEAASASVRHD